MAHYSERARRPILRDGGFLRRLPNPRPEGSLSFVAAFGGDGLRPFPRPADGSEAGFRCLAQARSNDDRDLPGCLSRLALPGFQPGVLVRRATLRENAGRY